MSKKIVSYVIIENRPSNAVATVLTTLAKALQFIGRPNKNAPIFGDDYIPDYVIKHNENYLIEKVTSW